MIYGFWDGDFTFHTIEYEGEYQNSTFRVRIDKDPMDHALENVYNPNGLPENWKSIRVATSEEIKHWVSNLGHDFPQRTSDETRALRFLRDNGPTKENDVFPLLRDTLVSLTSTRPCVRDFVPTDMNFVTLQQGVFTLTTDGVWLTHLMVR